MRYPGVLLAVMVVGSAAYKRQWRKLNPEKAREHQIASAAARRAKYWSDPEYRDRMIARTKAWHALNNGYFAGKAKEWRKARKDKPAKHTPTVQMWLGKETT